MKFTVCLFDGTYKVVHEEDYPKGIREIEDAMVNKTPIYLDGSIVAGSAISKVERFGNKENYGGPSLGSGFEQAAKVLENKPKKNVEKIKSQIRGLLKEIDPNQEKNRQYLAVRQLAIALHGADEIGLWHLCDWDKFLEVHPNAADELEKVGV